MAQAGGNERRRQGCTIYGKSCAEHRSQSPFGFDVLSDLRKEFAAASEEPEGHNRLSALMSFRTNLRNADLSYADLSHNRLSALMSFRT